MNDKINVGDIIKFKCKFHRVNCIGRVYEFKNKCIYFNLVKGAEGCISNCSVPIFKYHKKKLTKKEKIMVMKYLLTGITGEW